MATSAAERRRAPRVPVREAGRCELRFWSTVRVIDISQFGILLEAGRPIDVAEQAEFRVALDGEPFASTIEVRRQQSDGHPRRDTPFVKLGAEFARLDERGRRALERFLRRKVSKQP
jgi:hypothetical protein